MLATKTPRQYTRTVRNSRRGVKDKVFLDVLEAWRKGHESGCPPSTCKHLPRGEDRISISPDLMKAFHGVVMKHRRDAIRDARLKA